MGWADAPEVVAAAPTNEVVPAWRRAPAANEPMPGGTPTISGALRQHFESVNTREAKDFADYLTAGFQQSVVGLASRGKSPDVAVNTETPWYGRAAASLSTMAGDLPAMVPGFMAGAPVGGAAGSAFPVVGTAAGSLIGGFAGANALPAALRATMMDAYQKGEVKSASDFVMRAMHVAWETTKAGIVGGATGGAGIAAKAALPVAAGAVTQAVVPTAAQIATMTTVGKGLEGQLPEPQDFLDAAVVIGGLQGAATVAGRLRTIYAKTGRTPIEVVADVNADPSIRAELLQQEALAGATRTEGLPAPTAGPVPPPPLGVVGEASARPEAVFGQLELPGIPKAYLPLAEAETARAIVPGEKAAQVAKSPFAEELPQVAGEPAKPTHVNYNYINSVEDTKLGLARLSKVYEQEIQAQRRGTVSWEATSIEAAKMLSDTLGGVDGRLLMPREPGTAAGAAEILARKQMTIGAAEAMMGARDNLLAKGTAASLEDRLTFMASIERAAMIQSEFLGARAEAGRALNILKSTALEAERAKQIQSVIDMYGRDPMVLAEMLKEIDNPAGALKFASDAVKATTWEKVVEGWKAGILSGPVTHVANILGNGIFAAMRVPIDTVAAGFGALRGGADRVAMMEPVARLIGDLQGAIDGLKVAFHVLKVGEQQGKAEQFRKAIGGDPDSSPTARAIGEIVRVPFRALSAEDAVFNTMNQRAELYTLAVRQATAEGQHPLTREFRERVVQITQNPAPEMVALADAAATRFTFNTDLGAFGSKVSQTVRAGWFGTTVAPLQMIVPFIRTPMNILTELGRMTPFAPLVKEWREAIARGGAERDKALAELSVGTAIAAVVLMYAMDGLVSGAGNPDAGKRRVQQAAGWQPYSVKIGDTWYNYQRLQPLGTLMGIAADIAEVWDHLTENEGEADKAVKMLAVAFANAVTNQTFLQGITNVVNALTEPQRFGPKLAQSYAASVVPNVIAQPTAMTDPVVRQVDGMLDAIKARIPGLRGELLPKRDIFGEPLKTKERFGAVSPVTETTESTDKVRSEAARLGLSAADAPKKGHVGKGTGKIGDVKLTPQERDRFVDVGGHLAHSILSPIVNAADWDEKPDAVKKRIYERVFTQAHRAAAVAALPPERRAELATEIIEKVVQSLRPEPE